MKKILPFALLFFALPASAASPDHFTLDYETGPLFIQQNDGRYGPNGSTFTAGTVGQNRNLLLSERASVEATWGPHSWIFLYAPLDVTTRVKLNDPLTFRDTVFPAGSVVDSRYLFEGYRGSYLYQVMDAPSWKGWLGGTLQVRNAQVAFSDLTGKLYASESDIGLVPALKARLRHDGPRHYTLLEMDGLTTFGLFNVKGAILDTALTFGVPVNDRLDAFVRGRYLTGGADVSSRSIYNWANFFAATVGFRLNLK